MLETSLFCDVIWEKSEYYEEERMQVGKTNTKLYKRVGHLLGSRGSVSFRPSKETRHKPQNCTRNGSHIYKVLFPFPLGCLWAIIPFYFQVCSCKKMELVSLRHSRVPFPRKILTFTLVSVSTSQIQSLMSVHVRVVVWKKGVLISVFASVSGMLLKLSNIHPADFSWVKN